MNGSSARTVSNVRELNDGIRTTDGSFDSRRKR
jgi:hypothetical protein